MTRDDLLWRRGVLALMAVNAAFLVGIIGSILEVWPRWTEPLLLPTGEAAAAKPLRPLAGTAAFSGSSAEGCERLETRLLSSSVELLRARRRPPMDAAAVRELTGSGSCAITEPAVRHALEVFADARRSASLSVAPTGAESPVPGSPDVGSPDVGEPG